MSNRILPTLAILATVGVAAALAQTFAPNMPIIGGNSYCVNTVPAGPPQTGLETIPADTNAAQGINPQSGKFSVMTLGGGINTYIDGTANVTSTYLTRRIMNISSGTVTALTVTMPVSTNLIEGQLFGICTNNIITTLTVTAGSGTTVSLAPTALLVPVITGAASCVEWVYRVSNTTWYRVQ